MSNDLITSPVGTLIFGSWADKTFRKQDDKENGVGRTVFTTKILFDGSDPLALEFKKIIEKINPRLIGTKNAVNPGDFTVGASSKFDIKLMNSDGELLDREDFPRLTKGTTGLVSMTVKPNLSNSQGGGLYLVAVGIKELDIAEVEESEGVPLDALRASIKNG